jgi:hypothetical protein
MLVGFHCIDSTQSHHTEHDLRFESGPMPAIGDLTWMHPETHDLEWEVLETQIYSGPTQTLCLAGIGRGAIGDRDDEIHSLSLFILEGQVYTWQIGWSVEGPGRDCSPRLGEFQEAAPLWLPKDPTNFDPIPTKVLPVDKHIVSYEQLTGDSPLPVYIVQLERLPALVAA